VAADGDTGTVDDLLARLTATLGPDGATDDVAVLALRWTSPERQQDGGAAAPGRVD
jgi:hypothetical protein